MSTPATRAHERLLERFHDRIRTVRHEDEHLAIDPYSGKVPVPGRRNNYRGREAVSPLSIPKL